MAIRSGELSPAEHVTDTLDRLAADPYNAVVTLDRAGAPPQPRRSPRSWRKVGGGGRCTASPSG
jgi:hypothetical protein